MTTDGPIGSSNVRIEVEYYRVAGATPGELLLGMASSGIVVDGAHAVASTHARVVLGPSGRCGPSTTLELRVRLPQWTEADTASRQLAAWWDAVYEIVEAHEAEHVRIWTEAVDDLRAELTGRPCDSAPAIIEAWRAEVAAKHRAFDAHEQLATWPEYPIRTAARRTGG